MLSSFESLGLAPALMRAIADQGYTVPTPIQEKSIPVILAGNDVLAGAQTGTGKTAAFTLPLLQRLAGRANQSASPARHPIRALVLTPTRELAAQIQASVSAYGRHLALRSTVVYGGVGMKPQVDTLRRGVDVLVATPGRLLDHATQKTVDLSRVEILVLDEADRMLDMGFIRDIRRILALLPAARQNLLFSATFSAEIRRLADGLLRNPSMIEVARRNAEAELVSQRLHHVPQDRKRDALAHIVRSGEWNQVLVFTRTKHGANRLADHLQRDGISATAIHGNKSQPQRLKALAEFKQGLVRVLVATDIAARGLDIEALPHVVNFELPHVAEDYVHRIGRTGRAGLSGEAISLVSSEERADLLAIERLIGRKIEVQSILGWDSGAPSPARTDAGENLGRAPARKPAGDNRGRPSSRSQGGEVRGRSAPRGNGGEHRGRASDRRGEAERGGRDRRQPSRTGSHSPVRATAAPSTSEPGTARTGDYAPHRDRSHPRPAATLLGGVRAVAEEA